MTPPADRLSDPKAELRRKDVGAFEARVAVFTRVYDAAIEDVWDACTRPDRLRRWYAPVSGDLRLGGSFEQPPMTSGSIVRCEPPRELSVVLDGGTDQIDLALAEQADGGTVLEIQHMTTLSELEIGGQRFDAIFCMGGGYFPRLVALDEHLSGVLPPDYDPVTFHERPDRRSIIERGSAAMARLLEERA